MKHLRKLLLVTIFSVTCVPVTFGQDLIAADDTEEADLNSYETYIWAPEVNNTASENYINDRSLKYTIQQTIASELGDLGYTLTENGDPDFFVTYKVLKNEAYPIKGEESPAISAEVDSALQSRNMKEGTLVVQLLDRSKENVLWQGFATGILKDGDFLSHSPGRNEGAINNEPQNAEQLKDGGVSNNDKEGATPDERAAIAIRQMFKKFSYAAHDKK